jgi:hypothetical protein
MDKKTEKILKSDKSYFLATFKAFAPDLRGNRKSKVIEYYTKASGLGDLRARYKLAKALLLWEDGDRALGMKYLRSCILFGYKPAREFYRFYKGLSEPVTLELLKTVTAECDNPHLLLLAGQMHILFASPTSKAAEYECTHYGMSLIERAAQLSHLESIHFLYECYMGYFWQIQPGKEKARKLLTKYLSKTKDKIESAVLSEFEDIFEAVTSNRHTFRYELMVKVTSAGLPPERGSLDPSFYDKFREEV